MRFAALLPVLALLAACATPQQECVARATAELRTTQAIISETRQNLARGYALETRQVPELRWKLCKVGDNYVGCFRNDWEAQAVRVPIDRDAEQAKLDVLLKKERRLTREAEAAVAQCQRLYPE